jgi:hypothetical protein
MIMHLTQRNNRVKMVSAVTGLAYVLMLCLFTILIDALASGAHSPCVICSHEIAKSKPMRMIENVIIRNPSMDVDYLTAAHNCVVFVLSESAWKFSKSFASVRVHSTTHRESWAVVNLDVGENCAGRHCDFRLPLESGLISFHAGFNNDSGLRISSWSLAKISNAYGYSERLTNGKCVIAFYPTPTGPPKTDPSPLIYPHLRLDRIRTVLSRLRLLSSYPQLAIDFLTGFDGISRSLLSLGVQDASLGLHFLELAMEDPSSVGAHGKQKNRDPNHVPIGIPKPWIGVLWLCVGLALVGVGMWLLWIRSKASNSGREWFGCIVLAFLILGISLFPIVHGMNLILGI